MVNGIADKDKKTTNQQSKWSQFVDMNKYFQGVPLTRCQSAPCLHQIVKMKMPSAGVFGPTQLSLSWQLACNPADSSHLRIDDCVLRSHSKSDRLRAKNLKYKHRPKMKPKPFREKNVKSKVTQFTHDKPKIMVVDATKKQEREYQRNQKVEKVEIPFNKPDQLPVTARVRKPRAEMVAKGPKRTLGVPLCYRPTMLLGPRYYSDLQYYQQQQYYNQLQEQQRQQQQQQLMQQRIYYRPMQHMSKPPPQGYDYEQGPRYEVPIESMYHKLKKGSRYCGNFYYK